MLIKIMCLLSVLLLTACNTSVSDSQIPKRNNSASNYANIANEQVARDRALPQHGNADRP